MKDNNSHYICKVNKDNKIIKIIKRDAELDVLLEQLAFLNNNLEGEDRYSPILFATREPTIGNDIADEQRLCSRRMPTKQMDNTGKDLDLALKFLIVTDITISATGMSPTPFITREDAQNALHIAIMLLLVLKKQYEQAESDRQEQKDVVNDLFKQLGIKTKEEEN